MRASRLAVKRTAISQSGSVPGARASHRDSLHNGVLTRSLCPLYTLTSGPELDHADPTNVQKCLQYRASKEVWISMACSSAAVTQRPMPASSQAVDITPQKDQRKALGRVRGPHCGECPLNGALYLRGASRLALYHPWRPGGGFSPSVGGRGGALGGGWWLVERRASEADVRLAPAAT